MPGLVGVSLSLVLHAGVGLWFAVPRHPSREVPVDPNPLLSGETFVLPAPESLDAPLVNASLSSGTVAASPLLNDPDGPAAADALAQVRNAQRASHHVPSEALHGGAAPGVRLACSQDASGGGCSSSLCGAVGERSASDLATAFVHGFAQIASADPAWRTAALGAVGDGIIALTLDEAGHLVDSKVSGTASDALARGIKNTVVLLKSRTFTSKGKTTTLRFTGVVSADRTANDGLHGEKFALGSSFSGGEGSAFFALPIGRRIDIRVKQR